MTRCGMVDPTGALWGGGGSTRHDKVWYGGSYRSIKNVKMDVVWRDVRRVESRTRGVGGGAPSI